MIVVSDNGPLAFLIEIGYVEVLQHLYQLVVIPPAVDTELRAEGTPDIIRRWVVSPPSWLEVRTPSGEIEKGMSGLGEREAIQLAKELHAQLLCDDKQGVSRARREGLSVMGSLGVLREAHARHLLEITEAIALLRSKTDFRLPEDLLPDIVKEANAMRQARTLSEEKER